MIEHQISNSRGDYNYNAFIYTDIIYEAHFHGNYELIYAFSGKTTVSTDGYVQTLSAGDLLLIPPYSIHTIDAPSTAKIWVGVFSQDHIPSFAEKNRYTAYSKFKCDQETEQFLIKHLFVPYTPEIYLLESCLYLVCHECVRNAAASDSMTNSDFRVSVIEYISDNFAGNITLSETAKALNYEYHYFSALFHKNFFMNFKSFINIYRFEAAKKIAFR